MSAIGCALREGAREVEACIQTRTSLGSVAMPQGFDQQDERLFVRGARYARSAFARARDPRFGGSSGQDHALYGREPISSWRGPPVGGSQAAQFIGGGRECQVEIQIKHNRRTGYPPTTSRVS